MDQLNQVLIEFGTLDLLEKQDMRYCSFLSIVLTTRLAFYRDKPRNLEYGLWTSDFSMDFKHLPDTEE